MPASDRVRLTRQARFSAAHRYHSEALSVEENERIFGKCHRPHGHGHDYRVEVTVEGAADPVTGMVINLADLDRVLRERVIEPLDHRFLNHDVEHFATHVPTCENIALYLFEVLAPALDGPGLDLIRVRVHEGDGLYADVVAADEGGTA